MRLNNIFLKTKKLASRAEDIYNEKGIYNLLHAGIKRIYNNLILSRRMYPFWLWIYKTFKSSANFNFQGNTYSYFYHEYGHTWRSERVVEIPIIWDCIDKNHEKSILEVGNVLSNYFPVKHIFLDKYDILDKYEKAEGIINQDVVDFKPSKKYDLIVSISTLEHVGYDEQRYDEQRIGWYENLPDSMTIIHIIDNLKKALAPRGKIIVTVPIGYNIEMDRSWKAGMLPLTEQYYLKRISSDNRWIEVKRNDVIETKYGIPYPYANGIAILCIEIKAESS